MNRKYTTAEFAGVADTLREYFPDCAITTDIMTGFAGETDEEFKKTLEFAERMQFADAHIFQYSPRRGTPAARRPDQVPPEIKDARAKAVAEVCERSCSAFLRRHIGRTMDILFETRADDGLYEGKTANYINVHVPTDEELSGTFRRVRLERAGDGIMYGEIVSAKYSSRN